MCFILCLWTDIVIMLFLFVRLLLLPSFACQCSFICFLRPFCRMPNLEYVIIDVYSLVVCVLVVDFSYDLFQCSLWIYTHILASNNFVNEPGGTSTEDRP